MNHPSRRITCACLSLSVLSLIPSAGQAAPSSVLPRNAPDAFLPLPASSIESVLEQVQSDPVVRRHYARYLHLPQSRVASYLRANLVRSRLISGGLYTVYYVRPNGLIYPAMQSVSPGSPVFALRNGTPLLTWNEGDPLIRAQKSVHLGARVTPSPPLSVTPAPPVQIIVPTQVQTTVVPPLAPQNEADSAPASADSRQSAGKR